MRIYELAKELGVSSKDLVLRLNEAGFSCSTHMSVVTDEGIAKARSIFGKVPVKTSAPAETAVKKTTPPVEKTRSGEAIKDQMINSSKNTIKGQAETQRNDVLHATDKQRTAGNRNLETADDSVTTPAVPSVRVGQVGAFVDEESTQELFAVPLADRKGQEKYTRIFTEHKGPGGRGFRRRRNNRRQAEKQVVEQPKVITEVLIERPLHLFEAAALMGKQPSELILSLLKKGKACNRNDVLAVDMMKQLADQYGLKILAVAAASEQVAVQSGKAKAGADGEVRWPIVVVMGHVDHGKTTLLDFIRKKNIAASEKGGITQHLGAYEVESKKGKIVFLDTPGHEAFGYIRKQGAKVTDLAILVIAADDGIKPQTLEAIKHAREADVPIIVAINKIDKVKSATALETIKRQLAQHNLMTEDWGGQTICVPISAKTGEGVEHLLEMILLQAEMMDLQSYKARPAKAFVLESRLEKGYGPVATVICIEGTLKQGDYFSCGESAGKVRLLIDSHGNKVESIGPSVPVQVIGFNGISSIGEWLNVVTPQEYSKLRFNTPVIESSNKTAFSTGKATSGIESKKTAGRGINLIIKTDTRGSKEALAGSIEKLSRENKEIDCPIRIILSGIGDISESDIELAADTNSYIVGLHVKVEKNAQLLARDRDVALHVHQIIYHLVEFLHAEILKRKEVKITWEKSGELVVRKVFDIKGIGVIAGCYVREGVIARVNKVACVRMGKIVAEGKITSLQRDKKSVKEVHTGFECGFVCDSFNDWQIDDTVHVFKEVKGE